MLRRPVISIIRIKTEKNTIMPHIDMSEAAASVTLAANSTPAFTFSSRASMRVGMGVVLNATIKKTSMAISCAETIGIAA